MKFLKSLTALATVSAALGAQAATWSANQFSTGSNSSVAVSGGVSATISAFSNAPTSTANLTNTNATLTSAGSGIGVLKTGSGFTDATGMDNVTGIDGILINFAGGAQTLSSFSVAQSSTTTNSTASSGCGVTTTTVCGTDSDVSLLVWTGTSAPVLTSGISAGALPTTTGGWMLVGNYSNAGAVASVTTGTSYSSSWWLLTAYNSAWGGALTTGDDCVDVLGFATGTAATSGRTPEPTSLALVSLALLGMGAASRRKARR